MKKAVQSPRFANATQSLEELFECWNVESWDGNGVVVLCWGPKIWNLHCYSSAIVAMVRLAVFSQSTAVGPAQGRRRNTDYDGPSETSLKTLEMMKLSSEQLVPFATIGHLFDQIPKTKMNTCEQGKACGSWEPLCCDPRRRLSAFLKTSFFACSMCLAKDLPIYFTMIHVGISMSPSCNRGRTAPLWDWRNFELWGQILNHVL